MSTEYLFLGFGLFLIIALLYSSVGHAGASGYLAIMSLLSFPVDSIKSTSLVLNIIVASIASYKFIKAGYFDKKVFLTFAIASIPVAFISGFISIDPKVFKIMAGLFLILSSIVLVLKNYFVNRNADKIKEIPLISGLTIGAVIGFISGLIGVGGGIFLSPLMILMNWTTVKKASGIAALFILCNSVVALTGYLSKTPKLETHIPIWIIAVIIGGLIGSHLGTTRFNNKIIVILLFLVLISAGLKFIFVG